MRLYLYPYNNNNFNRITLSIPLFVGNIDYNGLRDGAEIRDVEINNLPISHPIFRPYAGIITMISN